MPTRVTWIGTTADGEFHAVDDLVRLTLDQDACAVGRGTGEGRPARSRAPLVPGACGAYAPASAAWARRARSTPARDSETRRRRAALGEVAVSQASVLSRVSPDTWMPG
ncbi:hypothetical protein SUDANB132_04383 [Streptomyces sp. enrichment culture]